MLRFSRNTALGNLAASLLTLFSTTASGVELAKVEGFGPISRGLAGAGVAHPTGAAAIMLNPAELMRQPAGGEFILQVSEINTKIEVRNRETGENVRNDDLGNNRGPYALPEIAYSYRRGDWAVGAGIFAAAGFGVEYGRDSFLSRTTTGNVATGLEISSRLSALRIPLALAWQPHARLRLGLAIDVVNLGVNMATLFDAQQVAKLRQQQRLSGELAGLVGALPTLAGVHLNFLKDSLAHSQFSGWGLGGRVGLSWQLSDATSLAVAYEMETRLPDLKGKGQLTAIDIFNTQLTLNGDGQLQDLQLPNTYTVGLSHAFSETLSLVADIRRTEWKNMLGEVAFAYTARGRLFDGQQLSARLPLGFNHITSISAGAEWSATPKWTLRAGVSHALQQLVKSESLSGTFPTISDNHLVANISFRPDRNYELTLGLSYGWNSGTIRNPGNNISSIPPIGGRNRQITPALAFRKNFQH